MKTIEAASSDGAGETGNPHGCHRECRDCGDESRRGNYIKNRDKTPTFAAKSTTACASPT